MEAQVQNSIWDKIFKGELENNRFGIIAIVLIVVGCLGGAAVGLGAINSLLQLILVVVPTMFTLTALLSVSPMKLILNASVVAVVIDILILAINIF